MSDPINDGGPITSGMEIHSQGESQRIFTVGGLSLRDWFAGMALQGMMSGDSHKHNWSDAAVAQYSYQAADAMIEERERKEEV